jgi:hypothetical protein
MARRYPTCPEQKWNRRKTRIISNLNSNLKAQIKTKHGLTEIISIKNSIRQGGVLSGALYALLMDEIAKEIQTHNIGIDLHNTTLKIGCLLWMDDVALFHHNPYELQKMLNTTEQVASKYRIEFGEPKSKILIIGKTKKKRT